MKKKFMLIILVIVCAFAFVACGDERDKPELTSTEGLEYKLDNGGQSYGVTGLGSAVDTEIVIASYYNDLPITYIEAAAFKSCASLTGVTVPDGVTSIGHHAFLDCKSITSIVIPESVNFIGEFAFYGCTSLADINFEGTKAQWEAMEKQSYWNNFTGDYTIICTDGTISK